MKIKSKFRRALIRSEIDRKLSNHGIPALYKMQPSEKAPKAALTTEQK